MRRQTRIAVVLAVVVGTICGCATPSMASAYGQGYCGPPVTSKQAMIAFYASPAGHRQAKAAERYVRKHAAYYHIQKDQSFMSWLQSPHIKFKVAPKGYRLTANTYCPTVNTVLPYPGHYDVGGLGMLWWCSDASGPGYNCTPITKGYCRNFTAGPLAFKKPPAHVCACKAQPPVSPPASGCTITINAPVNGTVGCNVQQQCVDSGGSWDSQKQICVTSSPPPDCRTTNTCSPPPTCMQLGTCSPPPSCQQLGTCQPPAKSITITAMTTLNMIPAGKSSGPFYTTVNASDPGGSLTVDPGIGSVSDCSGGSQQGSMTFPNLTAGNNTECLEIWAPSDADMPPSMTATFTATLGSAKDVKTVPFTIKYPTRT